MARGSAGLFGVWSLGIEGLDSSAVLGSKTGLLDRFGMWSSRIYFDVIFHVVLGLGGFVFRGMRA